MQNADSNMAKKNNKTSTSLDVESVQKQTQSEVLPHDEISLRAHAIFEREGRQQGNDVDHWNRAQEELRSDRLRNEDIERPSKID